MKKIRFTFLLAGLFLLFFVLWTLSLGVIDVRQIGPHQTSVAFSHLNAAVHRLTGVHLSLYLITDWLGLLPILVMLLFALIGLCQWIKRGNLFSVDADILILGVFYLILLVVYLLFEEATINYRPVLIEGRLEASYPSSTTMLVLCVTATAIFQINSRVGSRFWRTFLRWFCFVFQSFMVLFRFLSGVHWVTDIVGGILFSTSFVLFYKALISVKRVDKNKKGGS